MSLFGALFSGVSGLQSQSSAMGAIADNVTNVNTVGYKNTNVNFKTLITAQVSSTQYSPGGVQSAPRQSVDLQGLLQATTSATDMAISGSGFFVTNSVAQPDNNGLFTYSRAGSFKVDREGFLQNAAGAYLQGWPLTVADGSAGASILDTPSGTFMRAYIKDNGDKVLINSNVINSENLRPLNLQRIGGTASPTTSLSIGANLPAGADTNDVEQVNGLIFDSLGNSHNVAIAYTKTGANGWNSFIEPPSQAAVLVQKTQNTNTVYQAGGRLDFSDQAVQPVTGALNFTFFAAGSPQITITFDNTQLTTAANVNPNLPAAPPAGFTLFSPGTLNIDPTGKTTGQILDLVGQMLNGAMSDPSIFGTPLDPPGTWARHVAGENSITFDQADSSAAIHFDADMTDANGTQLIAQHNFDPVSATLTGYDVPALDGTLGNYSLAPNGDPNTGGALVTRSTNAIDFNGNGTARLIFGSDSAAEPNPKSTINIVWANGAQDMDGTPAGPAIQLNQGNYSTPDGITQLAGSFQLNFLQQNGAKFGNFSGVSIDKGGVVTALFDNGVTRPVFQIPLATFTNPNGLQSLSGNVWISTDFSGNPTLRQPGDAGAGEVNAAALEQSTVDLGTEFTKMITTQRAYSSSAKVITTADQMLDELLQIKR